MIVKLDYLLLGVLALGPRTGYGLKKYFDTFGRFQRSNTQMSQIYRTLTRMEQDGWILSSPVVGDSRNAREYDITEKGSTILLDWLSSPYEPPSRFTDADFQVRIGFSHFLPVERVIALVDTELVTREEQVCKYRERDRSLPTDNPDCDQELKLVLEDWVHRESAAAMDLHIENLKILRKELADIRDRRRINSNDDNGDASVS